MVGSVLITCRGHILECSLYYSLQLSCISECVIDELDGRNLRSSIFLHRLEEDAAIPELPAPLQQYSFEYLSAGQNDT